KQPPLADQGAGEKRVHFAYPRVLEELDPLPIGDEHRDELAGYRLGLGVSSRGVQQHRLCMHKDILASSGIWHAGTTVPTYGFLERDLGCSHVTNPGVPDRQASVGPDQVANLNRVQDRINTGMDEPAAQRHPEISKIAKVVSVPFLGQGEDAIEREGHAL